MSTRESYPADTTTPAAARRLCAQALSTTVRSESVDFDVAVVVTELVTNAVRAGATQVTVELTVSPGNIRIAVSDDAAGRPRMIENVPAHATHGRGLQIVNVLALRWGTVLLAQGKQVWAELSI